MTQSPDMPGIHCKVLLVDDDSYSLALLERIIRPLPDVGIYTAPSGFRALRLAQEHEFAAIVLDVTMPGMDGFETAQRLHATEKNKAAPILFATAMNVGEADRLKGYALGAVDYLIKPLVIEEVRTKVGKMIEMWREHMATRKELSDATVQTRRMSALLTAARNVLETDEFTTSARKIFDAAKQATGAVAGYVALLTPDGAENEVLVLDAGGSACSVAPELPMPIRGLCQEAYATGLVVHDNDFSGSKWMRFMPEGHLELKNALFAPLTISGKVEGVLGLANKPDGFTSEDVELAAVFGDFTAITLKNSRNLDRLQVSRRDLVKAQRLAGMGSFVVDLSTRRVEWSEGMCGVFGVSPGAAQGDDPFDCLPEPVKSRMLRLLARVEGDGRSAELEFEDVSMADGRARSVRAQVEGERDDKGRLVRLLGTCTDLTRQKAMARQIMTAQRLEAVGRLAGGVAHEINTPLQYMSGNLDYLDKVYQLFKEFYEELAALSRAEEARWVELKNLIDAARIGAFMAEAPLSIADVRVGLHKVSAIVNAMQQLAPMAVEKRAPVDLGAMIRDLVTITGREWQTVAEVIVELAPDLPKVEAAQGELSQAILNILMNAIQAVAQCVDNGEYAKGVIALRASSRDGFVDIVIEDNGAGIPEEHRDRVFDPFFTTREVGVTTGQGLAMAHFVVTGSDGTIDFKSEPGKGSAFHIRLPAILAKDE